MIKIKKGISVETAAEISRSKGIEWTKLGKLRRMRNLSQSQLAEISGVPKRNIECFEQKHRDIDGAHIDTLLNLCIALNCKLSDILENEDTIHKLEQVNSNVFEPITVDNEEIIDSDEDFDDDSLVEIAPLSQEALLYLKYFDNSNIDELTDDQKLGIKYVTAEFPEDWKECLKLRFIDKMSYGKIAKIFGISAQAVRYKVEKALNRLGEFESSPYVTQGLKKTKRRAKTAEQNIPPFERPIEELQLSGRTYNALKRAGVSTIAEAAIIRDDIINERNVGVHIVEEIREKIEIYCKKIIGTEG